MKRSVFVESWKKSFKKTSLLSMAFDLALLVCLVLIILVSMMILKSAYVDFHEIYPSLLKIGEATASQNPDLLDSITLDQTKTTIDMIKTKIVFSVIVFVLLVALATGFLKGIIWSTICKMSKNKPNKKYFVNFILMNTGWFVFWIAVSFALFFFIKKPFNLLFSFISVLLWAYFSPAIYATFQTKKTNLSESFKHYKNILRAFKIRYLVSILIAAFIGILITVLSLAIVYFRITAISIIVPIFIVLLYFNWIRNYYQLFFIKYNKNVPSNMLAYPRPKGGGTTKSKILCTKNL